MIHATCFRCRRRFELGPILVGMQLRKLKTKNPRHYQAVCPACQAVNKVSVSEMRKDLDAVREDIELALARQEAPEQAD